MGSKANALFVLVCEDGKPFVDVDSDFPAVFPEHFQAEEYLDLLGSSGWECSCDDHEIVEYRPVDGVGSRKSI